MTVWLTREVLLAIHDEQIAEHGGAAGVRDMGLLESAMARPRNPAAHGEADLATLAALHAPGIANNHPFVDGNKRTECWRWKGSCCSTGASSSPAMPRRPR